MIARRKEDTPVCSGHCLEPEAQTELFIIRPSHFFARQVSVCMVVINLFLFTRLCLYNKDTEAFDGGGVGWGQ